jgi:hypothetical protein
MTKLFEGMTLKELLVDLRSVKMPRIERIQAQALEHKLALDNDEIVEAWKLVRKYRKQLKQLHEARSRAKLSQGRKLLGLTRDQVDELRRQREAREEAQRNDLGL